jgi:hypothetical protein
LIPAFPFCCDKHSVKISDKWPGKEWEEEWSAGIAGRSHGSTNRWETWGYVRVCASSVEIQDRRGSTLSLRGEEIREPMGGKDNTTSLVTSRQALFHWAPDALYNAIPAPPPAPENRIPSGRQQRSRRLFHSTARSRALSFAVRLIHISPRRFQICFPALHCEFKKFGHHFRQHPQEESKLINKEIKFKR